MQIYLAPMEGITTFVYRNAFQHYYGGIDRYYTPFLSNKRLDYKDVNDVCPEHNRDIPLVPQILTNRADTFLEIAAALADYGYHEVNLNLGCPSGTVVSKKRGAGFLGVPDLLDAFLEEIFAKCPLHISVKTRIGMDDVREWDSLLDVFTKYPIRELIIHPRLRSEFYQGAPHTDAFLLAQERLKTPLCYNGDITSKASFQALEEQTAPLDAVMLGRGALADPSLPMLLRTTPEENAKEKSSAEAKDFKTFQAFHDEILEGYLELMSGDQPVLFRMKELWSYMGRYLSLSDRQLKKLQKANRLSDYQSLVRSILSECS